MTVPSDLTYYLEVNSVPLDTYAWRCLSYGPLFSGPAVRGDDLVMPGAAGRRPYPRIKDATVVSLSMHVYGWRDQAGAAITVPLVGLATHRDYLRANLGIGSLTGNGTVATTFHRGGAPADQTGYVHVLAMADWENVGGREATFRLDLSIPAGELT